MNSCVGNICIFLFLTVQGTLGSELTINVRRNASVTLVCYSREILVMCCPATPQNCHKCTDWTELDPFFQSYGEEKYFKLSALKPSDSGLYACFFSNYRQLGTKYRLNVFKDKNPTVVIGTVGQSIILSCGSELDNISSSEKHWCRLANATSCQPDTLMGPENDTRGDFKILATNSSFCLEKCQLTHNDTGLYRFTQTFQNQTKVHEVELQVKDEPNFLQISPVRVKPEELQIKCQYSQEMQEFQKSWLCDHSACPETVRSVDDRFQSALVLTIDHAACLNIKSFKCVAKTSGRSINSKVFSKPSIRNPIVNVEVSYIRNDKVRVKAYNQLNLICYKAERYYYEYERYDTGRWGRYDQLFFTPYWCQVRNMMCSRIKENVEDTRGSLKLQICVTPNDDGTRYRCSTYRGNQEVEIVVIAPPPPPLPRPAPHPPNVVIPPTSGFQPSPGIIVVLISIVLLIIMLLFTVYRFQGQKLMERLFARRTVLSAVDTHANMYANLVANYYSNNRRIVPPPDKQDEGNDKEDSSSSDDEFEELPVRPVRVSSVIQEETDYVSVKPGRAAQARSVGNTSKTNNDKMGKKQRQGTASSSGHTENKGDDDDDEVTYTHVIIKPKQQPK